MFLAFLATVSVPLDKEGQRAPLDVAIYHAVWVMHLAMFLTIILNYNDVLGIWRSTLNTSMVIFQVLVLISIFVL